MAVRASPASSSAFMVRTEITQSLKQRLESFLEVVFKNALCVRFTQSAYGDGEEGMVAHSMGT